MPVTLDPNDGLGPRLFLTPPEVVAVLNLRPDARPYESEDIVFHWIKTGSLPGYRVNARSGRTVATFVPLEAVLSPEGMCIFEPHRPGPHGLRTTPEHRAETQRRAQRAYRERQRERGQTVQERFARIGTKAR